MGNNIAMGKVDYIINNSTTLSSFFNYMRSSGERAIQTPIVLGNVGRNGTDDVRIDSYNARLTSTLGPRKVNELRFQWSRDFEYEIADAPPPETYANGSGNFSFGRATFLQRYALPDEKRLQFVDNFSYIAGKHAIKFGGEVNRVNDFINNPTHVWRQLHVSEHPRARAGPGQSRRSRNYTNYLEDFGLAQYAYNTIDFALFAQDQWKPFTRLTINSGLRWDKQTMPTPFAPNPAIPDSQKFPTDWRSFGPRIGVAYDVTGKGKTVLRGGYGIYYGRIPNGIIAYALQNTGLTDPTKALVGLTLQPTDPSAPVYPHAFWPRCRTNGNRSRTTVTRLDPSDFTPAARAGLHNWYSAAIAVWGDADGQLCPYLRRSPGSGDRQQPARSAIPAHLRAAEWKHLRGTVFSRGHQDVFRRRFGERECRYGPIPRRARSTRTRPKATVGTTL